MHAFTESFKNQVFSFANDANLKIKTSPRQEKNGTIALFDEVTRSSYTLHQNGYIRREIKACSPWKLGSCRQQYTLNRRIAVRTTLRGYRGLNRTYISHKLVMATPEEQLEILKERVTSYRITHGCYRPSVN